MRSVVRTIVAFVVAVGLAATAQAQTTLRVVMHSDLKILDPIWSGAYIVRQHGYLVFDTLFAIDANFEPQPQMAESHTVSADGLTTTIRLREGLFWHDGTPVTAEDCIASLQRWAVRDSLGQKLADSMAQWKVVDARTFALVLKQPFGRVVEALAKPSVVVPFMMPKRLAETDPFKQVSEVIGSGPYVFKAAEWKPGDKVVYEKNPRYVPRAEPPSGLAGGKVAMVDRIEWVWIPDPQTQVNALINGEIDLIETVAHDLLPALTGAKGVRVVKSRAVNQYQFRMNWLHPPFNDARIRRAVFVAFNQADFLEATIGNKDYFSTCKALFTCSGPYASTVAMNGLLEGDLARARKMVAEAGYDGRPVVVLHPTDLPVLSNLGPVAKSILERIGLTVDLQASDWQTMATRLGAKRGPPSEGGWSAFTTSWQQIDITDPLLNPYLTATCDKARPGWPCDARMEELRDQFARAVEPAKKREIAEAAQRHNTEIVTHIPLGEWHSVSAVSDRVTLLDPQPPFLVFWGVTKR
jgi:peptide/nickel transport system substrate-binding protein